MRNIFKFFAVALAMLSAVSCEKNEVPGNELSGEPITLTASITNGGTRTSLGDWDNTAGKFPVLWSRADEIAVIQGSNVFKFVLVSGEGTTSGVFICENHEGFQPSQQFNAFYPYDLVSVNEWNETIYNVPSEQPYVANNFASKVAPMAASGTIGKSLMFSNLFSVLKLQVKGTEKVQEIDVVSMVNMKMSGSAVLSFPQNGIPSIEKWESGARSVKLNCGEGVQLKNDEYTDFMIMIPPGNGQGWAVVIKTENNVYYKSSSRTHGVAAGTVMPMKGFDLSEVKRATINSYVENGVYLGEGIKVDNLYWAPVNCGYERAIGDYKGYTWGKLYQWSRGGGCGYSYDDASVDGFTSNFSYVDEWSNNPCPAGWRIPSKDELDALKLYSSELEEVDNQEGYWFGSTTTSERIFFQAAGSRTPSDGGEGRRQRSLYWSSTKNHCLNCIIEDKQGEKETTLTINSAAYKVAMSVRCVKNAPPMPS